jgi:hypothetical protein
MKNLKRRKDDEKFANLNKLQNTMRWAFMTIIKLNVFVVVVAIIIFSAVLVHISLNLEGVNIRDLGEFVYNYWFGIGLFHTGSLASAGGAKAVQKFGERKGFQEELKNEKLYLHNGNCVYNFRIRFRRV